MNDRQPVRGHGRLGLVFIVEPGYLEWQAIVLVSSLRAFCYDDYVLYAYCREDRIDNLRAETKAFLEQSHVTLRGLRNPFPDGYPQGNKILACAAERPEPVTVFLDTDTIACRPFFLADAIRPDALSAVPVRQKTWSEDLRDWERLFRAFGDDLPSYRVFICKTRDLWVPYFNGGVVIYADPDFGEAWVETALSIDRMEGFPSFRPWLDQVSLTVAAHRHGLRFNVLDMAWNDTPQTHGEETRILHYHTWTWLRDYFGLRVPNQLVHSFSSYDDAQDLIRRLGIDRGTST